MRILYNFFTPLRPQTWCRVLLLFFLGLAILLLTTNAFFLIQEFMLRKEMYEKIGKALAQDMYVATQTHIDSEKILLPRIKYSAVPHKVIIGSSHVQYNHPDITRVFKVIACSGCTIKNFHEMLDCMIFYHGTIPQNIILEITPWCFNTKDFKRSAFAPYSNARESVWWRLAIVNIAQIINLLARRINDHSYWIDKISKKAGAVEEFALVTALDAEPAVGSDWNFLSPDGRVAQNGERLNSEKRNDKTNIVTVMDCTLLYNKQFSSFNNIDADMFKGLLKRINRLGSTVRAVYLTPYSPVFIDFITKKNKLFLLTETEQACRNICAEMNIPIIGSYDPKCAGNLSQDDFYDRDHVNPGIHKKLLGPLVEEERN